MVRLSVTLIILFISLIDIHGQGCSDAGFCTMGAMKPDQPFNKKIEFKLRSMELSFYRGTTTLTPVIYVATADLNFSLNARNFVQVKIPYQAVRNGHLGETSGLGDISLCYTRKIYSNEKFDVNLSLGGKIATNNADKTENGKQLPMYYQTSLGTYDIIAGISVITRQWLFATGIQHPFNRNKNNFTWDTWPNFDDQAYLLKYNQASQLKRGTDVMLRVERNFRFSRWNFSAGLLPIYRINHDQIIIDGVKIKPDGAIGLALSGIVTTGYNFNVHSGVKLLVGHKIVQRKTNPDGLTRELVTSVTYSYRF